MRRKAISTVWILCLLSYLFAAQAFGQQQPMQFRTGSYSLGVDIGAQGATADGGAFAAGVNGEYFVTHNFSVGPLLQIGVTDDLFQIAPSAQAKFTFDIPDFPELKPNIQAGVGFIYAELDRRGAPDRDDTSFIIPIGFGADYWLSRDLSVGTSVLFNVTDLERIRNENFFVTWFIGLKLRF